MLEDRVVILQSSGFLEEALCSAFEESGANVVRIRSAPGIYNVEFEKAITRYPHLDILVNDASYSSFPKICFDMGLIEHMLNQGNCKVISILPSFWVINELFEPELSSSLAGIIGFMKAAARKYAKAGVYCNLVMHGYIEGMGDIGKQESIPLGRFAKPEEIVNVILFLARNATYMTGQTINVDGGLSMV